MAEDEGKRPKLFLVGWSRIEGEPSDLYEIFLAYSGMPVDSRDEPDALFKACVLAGVAIPAADRMTHTVPMAVSSAFKTWNWEARSASRDHEEEIKNRERSRRAVEASILSPAQRQEKERDLEWTCGVMALELVQRDLSHYLGRKHEHIPLKELAKLGIMGVSMARSGAQVGNYEEMFSKARAALAEDAELANGDRGELDRKAHEVVSNILNSMGSKGKNLQ